MTTIANLRAEHGQGMVALGSPQPRLSWELRDAEQVAYEIAITGEDRNAFRTGRLPSTSSTFVAWPTEPLRSREVVQARVRAWTADNNSAPEWSAPLTIEASLLKRSDWETAFICPSEAAPPHAAGRQAFLLRAGFEAPAPEDIRRARIYATAHGMYELELNGRRVGDQLLTPGWTSYLHRLRFQTYDITSLLRDGENVIGAWLADGWYRGRLGFHGGRWNNYGSDLSLLAQLEITRTDGSVERVNLDQHWRTAPAPITASGLYEGERFDARLIPEGWGDAKFDDSDWQPPTVIPLTTFGARLEPPTGPAVTVTQTLRPVSVERRGPERVRLDFGQNIAGRLRIRLASEPGVTVTLHHAEVLDHGELALRPLRTAAATDSYTFRSHDIEEWAPRFTYHGFRYAELEGWSGALDRLDVVAEVIHTDMERSGWFNSSHSLLNRFHENTVWGMRANFIDLPTDCPQRDERLGWTGDIQVFAPAALFLFHSAGTLAGWMRDVAAEQRQHDGAVPNFVPWIECGFPAAPAAAWGDAAVIVPWNIYERTGDTGILADQFDSMCSWVDMVERLSNGQGLWNSGFQLGDWLDPAAPPDRPSDSHTDGFLVATAYFAHSARLLARVARILGRVDAASHYEELQRTVTMAFQQEFVSPSGRVVSDTVSALSLALVFDLLATSAQRETAGARLADLVVQGSYRVQTGFVGTPIVCDALVLTGSIDTAYRLLLQEQSPSWLYPVTMGATTVWERWDSMLPDGEINPGEMTSFNHYALGAVVDFLHRVVAGLAPASPGYREILVAPRPGGGLEHASARHRTPLGTAEVSWRREHGRLIVEVLVPRGARALVRLPVEGWHDLTVGGGRHSFNVEFPEPAVDGKDLRPEPLNPHRERVVEAS